MIVFAIKLIISNHYFHIVILNSFLFPSVKESSLILLQSVPPHIKTDEIRHKLIQEVEGPLSIHELHIWQLAGDRIVATVHIR